MGRPPRTLQITQLVEIISDKKMSDSSELVRVLYNNHVELLQYLQLGSLNIYRSAPSIFYVTAFCIQ